jgi:hypothetical protein
MSQVTECGSGPWGARAPRILAVQHSGVVDHTQAIAGLMPTGSRCDESDVDDVWLTMRKKVCQALRHIGTPG